ncbi:MAG: hypothetical protein JWM98_2811 [Thermoleophilia bacterium]|nr:hypothetical protein [Thermoleophilia bacterium]
MKTSKRTKLLAFAPALLVVGVTAVVASGASMVSGATAASTVAVNGTVASTFSTSPTTGTGSGPTSCTDETLVNFTGTFAASDGCQISFTSNNPTGAEVVMTNNSATDPAFFCADPDGAGAAVRTCASDAVRLEDLVGTGNTIPAASDFFGIALMSVGGTGATTGTTVAGSGVSAPNAAPTGASAVWAGIPKLAATSQLCKITENNATTSTCQFKFGGSGEGATQSAGDYTGTLKLTAQLT